MIVNTFGVVSHKDNKLLSQLTPLATRIVSNIRAAALWKWNQSRVFLFWGKKISFPV